MGVNKAQYTKILDDLDAGAPTVSLEVWREMEAYDGKVFWRVSCGHHENLLDAALERIAELEHDLRST